MTDTDTEARVNEVLGLVLALPAPVTGPVLRSATPAWDSLAHVEIIYALEETFGVLFPEESLTELDGTTAIATRVDRLRAA
ncbi:acyl carrier protein [Klenkia soli]|uniref:Acyl carrier protein n=1 Tax=Klenkia soli TaxID=1052260 RepID=A0A1H0CIL3_9ACTN|nr:acyl carrier protein [Klenkia soli]SDN57685.1 acyl carrier protein [Klenkia soli]